MFASKPSMRRGLQQRKYPFCTWQKQQLSAFMVCDGQTSRKSTHVLIIGADHSVCVVLQVCEGCRPKLKQMCSKPLPCQHWCCATRGSSSCLPCLQAGCEHQVRPGIDTGTCGLPHVC
jgi:hypothetical protein